MQNSSAGNNPPQFQGLRFYATRHDLAEDIRIQIVALLDQTLSTALDLKSQVKQAHWNVKGMNFYALHRLFDEMATQLEDDTDALAERITALGSTAMGTIRFAAQRSELPEYNFESVSGSEHVATLIERLSLYAQRLRAAICNTAELGDAGTADLYTEISRTADQYLWFLESHLQSGQKAEIK